MKNITAKDLFELIWSLDKNKFEGFDIHLTQVNGRDILVINQYIPKLDFQVRITLIKNTKATAAYTLSNKDIIYTEGTVYLFSCSTWASGVSHITIEDSFRQVSILAKKGDFVLNHHGSILSCMWEEDLKQPYSAHVRIVDGKVVDFGYRTEGKLLRYKLSGYSVTPDSEGELRARLIASGYVGKLKLNEYLSDENKI